MFHSKLHPQTSTNLVTHSLYQVLGETVSDNIRWQKDINGYQSQYFSLLGVSSETPVHQTLVQTITVLTSAIKINGDQLYSYFLQKEVGYGSRKHVPKHMTWSQT